MILIYGNMHDRTRTLLCRAPLDFDVRQWAESRRAAFALLRIESLTVEEV